MHIWIILGLVTGPAGIQQVWHGAWDSAFLNGFQMMPGPPVTKAYWYVCSSLPGIKSAALFPKTCLHVIYLEYYCGLWVITATKGRPCKGCARGDPDRRTIHTAGCEGTRSWAFLPFAVPLSELPRSFSAFRAQTKSTVSLWGTLLISPFPDISSKHLTQTSSSAHGK